MRPRMVVVAHREAMVAEGIAAALATYPGIVAVAATTSASEAAAFAGRADAVALDQHLPAAQLAADHLRREGVRVVLIGDGRDEDGIRVPTGHPVAALAAALVPGTARVKGPPLSDRQAKVLALVARGLTARQVARALGISERTVEQHKARIFAKLGVPNQAAAVAVAATGAGGGP